MKHYSMKFASLAAVILFFTVSTSAVAKDLSLSSGKTLTFSQTSPPPAPLYSDLLNVTQSQVMYTQGRLQMADKVRALFLPDYTDPQHHYAYNTASGARLAHQLKRADGKVVDTHFYHGQLLQNPFWVMHPTDTNEHKLEAGEHVLEFYLEGQHFYSFPFSVRALSGADAYNPETRYLLDGPWGDYAYIYIAKNNPSSTPMFSIWLRDETAKMGDWREHQFSVTFKRNGKAVAAWPGDGNESPFDLKPWYIRFDISLRGIGQHISAGELIKDGTYEVVVTQDGQSFATYSYQAKDGKFVQQDRQVRDKTDPLFFIEGGGERYFMKRQS